MSEWPVSREQWAKWIEEGRVLTDPVDVLDAWDGQFRAVLRAMPFGQSAEVTNVSVPVLDPLETYDSMPTMVRTGEAAADEDVDAAQTLVHGARVELETEAVALDISLRSPEGGLQVELEAPGAAEAQGDWYIPPLTERSVVGPAPTRPASPPPPPPPAAPVEPERAASPPPPPPPRAATPDATALGPPPPFDAAPSREDVAVRTGTTLVPIEPSASSSQTAGEIVTVVDDAADDEPPPPRRSSKIVVAPTPEVVVAVTEAEPEPDVLESSDLLEHVEAGGTPPLPAARPAAPPPPPEPSPRSTDPSLRAVDGPPVAEPARPPEPPPAQPPPPPPRPQVEAPAAYITGQTLPPVGPRHWSEAVFAAHYSALGRVGSDRIAAAEVEFIAEITQAPPSATVVDVGCGEGRHAHAFAERGHRTIGLDCSEAQIHLATEAFGVLPKLRWVRQDVRDRGLGEQFDIVACLGTTFGIYGDAENRAVLESLRDLCSPSGRIVIHVVNRDYVIPRLPARTWWQGQGCLVLDEVDVNDATSRINVKRTIVFEDGRQFEHVYDVRVFAVHELVELVTSIGLGVVEVSGSRHTRGRFFGATSPDIWLVARR